MLKKQQVYKQILTSKLTPFDVQIEEDFKEFYYHLNDKQYRVIYDHRGDWFCDIIYEGNYV